MTYDDDDDFISVLRAESRSRCFTPVLIASMMLSAVTLPNSRNLKDKSVRNRRQKSDHIGSEK